MRNISVVLTLPFIALRVKSSSVIRQFQNGCYQKTKHAKFSEKRRCLTPRHVHARMRIKIGVFCFLVTFVLTFAYLPTKQTLETYYTKNQFFKFCNNLRKMVHKRIALVSLPTQNHSPLCPSTKYFFSSFL